MADAGEHGEGDDDQTQWRKATPAENLEVLKARLFEHLSPAEKNELDEAIMALRARAEGEPFGWYDHFNDVLYRNKDAAESAERGGNKITPFYTHPAPAGMRLVPEEPTEDMLIALLRGCLWHQILTFDQPLQPQLLTVEKPDIQP